MQDKIKTFATDSLVESCRSRIDNSLPPMSGASRKPLQMSNAASLALEPMPAEIATKLVRRLLAGYPNLKNVHDPDGYIAALTETMAGYPTWAGERTILRVDEKGDEFPPSEKTLRAWLNECVAPYKFAAEWNARVEEQLKERAESGLETDNLHPRAADGVTSYDNYDAASAKHGAPISPSDPRHSSNNKGGK